MIRWYISPYSGTGRFDDPFHAACWDHTDPEKDKCRGTRCPAKRHYIVRVEAPEDTHKKIVDAKAGTVISGLFKDEAEESTAMASKSDAQEIKEAIKKEGYPTDWMTDDSTLRDVIRCTVVLAHKSQKTHKTAQKDEIFKSPVITDAKYRVGKMEF